MKNIQSVHLKQIPPLINGLSLILWGWQCDFMSYAILMALLIESAKLSDNRLPISQKEFNLISDLSSIIFLCVVIYIFSVDSFEGIFIILSLLPFLFYPLILAQTWSTRGNISLSTLFISLRRLADSGKDISVDISYPYFFVCLIAASAGNHHPLIFFICISLLIILALWFLKPGNSDNKICFLFLLFAVSLSYPGHQSLQYLQSVTESKVLAWFETLMEENLDPDRVSTAIGSVGRLKLSDRIRLRIDSHDKTLGAGVLLMEATYTNYGYGTWTNYDQTFRMIDPGLDGKAWTLRDGIISSERLTINYHLPDKKGVLPIPHNTTAINNMAAVQVDHGQYGTVSIEYKPGWIRYDTIYVPGRKINASAPGDNDLDIPNIYKNDLLMLVEQLGLQQLEPLERINKIKRFFYENFSYSLTQTERYPRGKYLSKFLFKTRKGHCEYFATATALLLRAAGIPSRYVIGYSIQEFSELEDRYIARSRDAHSWVIAWIDNGWRVIDTTPPEWFAIESGQKTGLGLLYDIFSWAGYILSSIGRDDGEDRTGDIVLLLIVLALCLYITHRLIKNGNLQRIRLKNRKNITSTARSGDSDIITHIFNKIEARYHSRRTGQTLLSWAEELQDSPLKVRLKELLVLYYRCRFDPANHSAVDMEKIHKIAALMLKDI